MKSVPPLRLLHDVKSLNKLKLEAYRKLPTETLVQSLAVNREGALKVRPDGTVLDGNHRIYVLKERKYDVDSFPRMLIHKHEMTEDEH
jgi:hypothetical protein